MARRGVLNREMSVAELEEGDSLELVPRPPVIVKTDDSYATKFKNLEELGKGKFGIVYKSRDKKSGEIYAAKFVRKSAASKKEVLREIEMMNYLHHKRLIQLYDAYETKQDMIVIMELVTGGELFEKVVEEDNLTEKQVIRYMKQVLFGVQHMHRKHMVHLDLKPENILCLGGGKAGYEEIKLIDFGMTRVLKAGEEETAMCGTPEFVAPEVITFNPITIAADMWSIGVITYVLLSGLSPFMGDDDGETLKNVASGEYDFEDEDEIFENLSDGVKIFIQDLLVINPKERLTVDECLAHSWLRNEGSDKKINTSNLKKFIARRRWQRTMNTIKAVSRLAGGLSLFGNKGSGAHGAGKGNFLASVKAQQAKEDEDKRKSEAEAAEKKKKDDEAAEKKRKEEVEAVEKKKKASEAAEKKRKEEAEAAEKKKKDAEAAEKKRKEEAEAADKKKKAAEASEKKRKEEVEAVDKKKKDAEAAEKKRNEEAEATEKKKKDAEAAEKKRKEEAEAVEQKKKDAEAAEKKKKDAEAAEKKRKEEAEAVEKKKKDAEAAEKKKKDAEAAEKKRKEEAEAVEKKKKDAEAAEKKQKEEAEAVEKKKKDLEAAERKQKEETEVKIEKKPKSGLRASFKRKKVDNEDKTDKKRKEEEEKKRKEQEKVEKKQAEKKRKEEEKAEKKRREEEEKKKGKENKKLNEEERKKLRDEERKKRQDERKENDESNNNSDEVVTISINSTGENGTEKKPRKIVLKPGKQININGYTSKKVNKDDGSPKISGASPKLSRKEEQSTQGGVANKAAAFQSGDAYWKDKH